MTSHKERKLPTLEITARDFPHHQKNDFWYIGLGILVIGGVLTTIRIGEYLLAGVIAAGGIAMLRLANIHPKVKKVSLTVAGVYWGDMFLPYHKLKAFWLGHNNHHTLLYLEQVNNKAMINFVLTEDQAEQATRWLSNFLPIHFHKGETSVDRINRFLRY